MPTDDQIVIAELQSAVARLTRERDDARALAGGFVRVECVQRPADRQPEASGEAYIGGRRVALACAIDDILQGGNGERVVRRLEAWLDARGGKAAT